MVPDAPDDDPGGEIAHRGRAAGIGADQVPPTRLADDGEPLIAIPSAFPDDVAPPTGADGVGRR
jgi:hypothetical protein